MKRNAKKTVVVIALIALMAIPSMMAYFTDTASKTNEFTVGKVDITLTEHAWDAAEEAGTNEADSFVPNQTITKDPAVKLGAGSENAYVFVKVTVPTYTDDESNVQPLFTYAPKTGWTEVTNAAEKAAGVQVWARDAELAVADGEVVFFDQVKVADVPEDKIPAETNIVVKAYALQTEGYEAAEVVDRWNAVKTSENVID